MTNYIVLIIFVSTSFLIFSMTLESKDLTPELLDQLLRSTTPVTPQIDIDISVADKKMLLEKWLVDHKKVRYIYPADGNSTKQCWNKSYVGDIVLVGWNEIYNVETTGDMFICCPHVGWITTKKDGEVFMIDEPTYWFHTGFYCRITVMLLLTKKGVSRNYNDIRFKELTINPDTDHKDTGVTRFFNDCVAEKLENCDPENTVLSGVVVTGPVAGAKVETSHPGNAFLNGFVVKNLW